MNKISVDGSSLYSFYERHIDESNFEESLGHHHISCLPAFSFMGGCPFYSSEEKKFFFSLSYTDWPSMVVERIIIVSLPSYMGPVWASEMILGNGPSRLERDVEDHIDWTMVRPFFFFDGKARGRGRSLNSFSFLTFLSIKEDQHIKALGNNKNKKGDWAWRIFLVPWRRHVLNG